MGIFDDIVKVLQLPGKPAEWLGDQIGQGVNWLTRDNPQQTTQFRQYAGPGGQLESEKYPGLLPTVSPTSEQNEFIRQLIEGINSGQPSILSPQEIRNRANKRASSQFNPQIESIREALEATRTRASKGRKGLGDIYGDLAGSYVGDIKKSEAGTKQAKKSEKQTQDQMRKRLAQQRAEQVRNQAQEFKRLGIESALNDATLGQQEDTAFLNSLNEAETGAQQRAIDLTGQADEAFYRQGRGLAQREGTEMISDLMTRLEDYERSSSSDISQLVGQRTSLAQQLIDQMQSGQSTAQSEWESNRWNKLMQIAKLQSDLQAAATKNSGSSNTPTKGYEGAYSILQQMLGGNASQGVNDFNNLMQLPEFREDRFKGENEDIVDMTPENAAYMARKWAQENGLDETRTQALINAVLARYGALR